MLCVYGGGIFSQENTLPETGSVGIGTLNPSAKLDVNGHVRIDSTLMIKDSLLVQKNTRIQENLKVEGQFHLPNIAFANGLGNQELLVKDGNGQVKTASLSALSDALYSKVCPTDPTADILSPTWQNGLNKIYYDCPQVNVGIGTNLPRVKLEVQGTTFTSKLAININPLAMTGWFHMKTGISNADMATIFVIENTERRLFQISNDGVTRAREMKIDLLTWADYVFKENYSLKSLFEVEQFIRQNGHLPNVPSEKQVVENGLALGEMSRVLLEKIEELTLYIIEQEKRINELEVKINK